MDEEEPDLTVATFHLLELLLGNQLQRGGVEYELLLAHEVEAVDLHALVGLWECSVVTEVQEVVALLNLIAHVVIIGPHGGAGAVEPVAFQGRVELVLLAVEVHAVLHHIGHQGLPGLRVKGLIEQLVPLL